MVGTVPTSRGCAWALRPQYGELIQVMPATASVTTIAMTQATGTQPTRPSTVRDRGVLCRACFVPTLLPSAAV